ncbi:hypothetical protein Vca1114GL_03223 [Vibrio campbellii]|uniref:HAD family hydrolase n=1 Tax=Vibrio campbellii TaxID=680 RepID=UPI00097FAB6A|nr:HAD family hydrolase [Vibrio campbellii]AQM69649.1 hypothetical protein Vca1114GL_03223 [Vibrio campbellii]
MIYLFDWGNTLMVDFPHAQGKMCDWEHVETVPQAKETLAQLTQDHQVFIATSASDSVMEDVQKAFQRVGLDQYLSGYFCFANLGIAKNQPDFYLADAGLNVIWFNPKNLPAPSKPIPNQIRCLSELLRT